MTATGFSLPRSLDEAVDLLGEYGDELTVLGGGTIVMGLINDGLLFPRLVLSLTRAGLDGVQASNGHLRLGATVTLAGIAALDDLSLLAEAARQIGGPALRTTATIGGNLFARPPYGDLAVPLLALDAQVDLAGPKGHRTLPLSQFLAGRQAVGTEVLAAITVARPEGRWAYLKLARRQANAASVIAVAVRLVTAADGTCSAARIALGAAGPHALRSPRAEAALVGRKVEAAGIAAAAEAAMAESDPFTDALASAWYRRKMVGVYVRRALERAAGLDSPGA